MHHFPPLIHLMGSKRCIIHLNIMGFAHAVAALQDPSLRNRPVVVAAQVNRSQILDLSPHAFASGIRKGMALPHALRLCPDCLITPPKFDLYQRAMTALCHEIKPFSPFIEPGRADGHIFADLSGTSRLFGPGVDVAKRICQAVTAKLGLTPGWALGPNKLVAKVASRVSRAQGECEVATGNEALFLAPHALMFIPGTKAKELHDLDDFCLNTIGDTVKLNLRQLQVLLDKRAAFYHDACRGIDTLPVGERHSAKNITATFTLPTDSNDERRMREILTFLGTHIGFGLRKQNSMVTHMSIEIGYADTTTVLRKIALQERTNNDLTIINQIQADLPRVWTKRIRVRTISLRAERLVPAGQQLLLFTTQNSRTRREQKLMAALDTISSQFGMEKVQRGRALRVNASF